VCIESVEISFSIVSVSIMMEEVQVEERETDIALQKIKEVAEEEIKHRKSE